MGFEPVLFVRPPLRLAWIELRARIGLCRCPAGSPAALSTALMEVRDAVSEMGWSGDRPGCPPRLLCCGDLRGGPGALGRSGAQHPGGAGDARREFVGV